MSIYRIGNAAYWEINDGGFSIRYISDTTARLNFDQLSIVNVIVMNSINFDNYITAAQIAKALGYDEVLQRETIKKTIQRIRCDEDWHNTIETSRKGYHIKVVQTDLNESTSGNASILPDKNNQLSSKNTTSFSPKESFEDIQFINFSRKLTLRESDGKTHSFEVICAFKIKNEESIIVVYYSKNEKDIDGNNVVHYSYFCTKNGKRTLERINDPALQNTINKLISGLSGTK